MRCNKCKGRGTIGFWWWKRACTECEGTGEIRTDPISATISDLLARRKIQDPVTWSRPRLPIEEEEPGTSDQDVIGVLGALTNQSSGSSVVSPPVSEEVSFDPGDGGRSGGAGASAGWEESAPETEAQVSEPEPEPEPEAEAPEPDPDPEPSSDDSGGDSDSGSSDDSN